MVDQAAIPELVVHCSPDGDGATFCRPDGSRRVWLSERASWGALAAVERDAVCRLVWAVGTFEVTDVRVVDPVTDEVVGTHTLLPP